MGLGVLKSCPLWSLLSPQMAGPCLPGAPVLLRESPVRFCRRCWVPLGCGCCLLLERHRLGRPCRDGEETPLTRHCFFMTVSFPFECIIIFRDKNFKEKTHTGSFLPSLLRGGKSREKNLSETGARDSEGERTL